MGDRALRPRIRRDRQAQDDKSKEDIELVLGIRYWELGIGGPEVGR